MMLNTTGPTFGGGGIFGTPFVPPVNLEFRTTIRVISPKPSVTIAR